VRVDDVVDVTGLAILAPGSTVTVVLHHSDGTTDSVTARHTMSDEHIAWFRAGSALNLLATQPPAA
jgi:aconitate hydratase